MNKVADMVDNDRFNFLLEIKLEQGVVTVLDSKRKDPKEYVDMTEILKK